MKLLCNVNQAECLRYGVDAPSSTVQIEVDPKSLTEEQRNFVADNLYDGLRFPKCIFYKLCPPTYEGFIAAVNYGLEYREQEGPDGEVEDVEGLKKIRQSLVKAAIKESAEQELDTIPF